jgi:hypothetical protein
VYGTLSKDLERWTGLPVSVYAGASFGTFDDEWVEIGGVSVRWSERVSSTSLWDGHNLHHLLETTVGDRWSVGVVVVDVDGEVDVGLTASVGF